MLLSQNGDSFLCSCGVATWSDRHNMNDLTILNVQESKRNYIYYILNLKKW